MKTEYQTPINAEGLEALQKLIGSKVCQVFAPELYVDLDREIVTAFRVCIRLSAPAGGFINVTTVWHQTKLDDYHELCIEYSETPIKIPYKQKDRRIEVGPVSGVECDIGQVNKVEILQSSFELVSESIDGNDEPIVESIIYDRGVNVRGDKGVLSLATEFGPILGDIRISNAPISKETGGDERLSIRELLSVGS